MDRRRFLRWGGALGTTLVVGRYFAGRGHAAPFGEAPPGSDAATVPPARRVRRVLEVFLYGGLSPWESLYFVPGYGTPADPDARDPDQDRVHRLRAPVSRGRR